MLDGVDINSIHLLYRLDDRNDFDTGVVGVGSLSDCKLWMDKEEKGQKETLCASIEAMDSARPLI